MPKRTFLAVCLLAVAFATRLGAISYYVDFAGGADDNHGTGTEVPWKHCPGDPAAVGCAAVCLLVPGDVVTFKGGVTYVFSGTAGIVLKWSGEPGSPITYDGNSGSEWGEGRAKFTDNRGAGAITAFAATDLSRHLVFKSLEIGPIGGAAELPADPGVGVAARYGGGIIFAQGCQGIVINDCVFRDLGYAFNQKPMNAASVAGTAVRVSGSVRELTVTRGAFSRLALGLDLSRTSQISGVVVADSTFGEAMVWPLNLPAMEGTLASSMISVRDSKLGEPGFFDDPKWNGHGPSPRLEQIAVTAGDPITLVASAIAAPAATFSWFKNNVPMANASASTLSFARVTKGDEATYTVVATNSEGFAGSNSAVLVVTERAVVTDDSPTPTQSSPVSLSTPPPPPSEPPPVAPPSTGAGNPSKAALSQFVLTTLVNDAATSIMTFAVENVAPRQVLIRASGPTLSTFGLKGTLSDPRIELFRGEEFLAGNDDWGGREDILAAVSRLGIFPFVSAESKDAALLVSLSGGDYRVITKGAEPKGGLVLIEIRELP